MIPDEALGQLQWDAREAAQRETFHELAGVYREAGVVRADGFAPALVDCCPHCEACWSGCEDRVSRGANVHNLPGQDGAIFFPWLGLNYRPGGVCVVGWNLNNRGDDWFPLTEEHVIARASRSELEKGRRKVWGSLFAYRSVSAAACAHDSLHGVEPIVNRRAADVAGYVDAIARAQAVKCAPLGARSNPSPAMNDNCPPTFLRAELQILKPRVLVVFGAPLAKPRCTRSEPSKHTRRRGHGDERRLRATPITDGVGTRRSAVHVAPNICALAAGARGAGRRSRRPSPRRVGPLRLATST